MDQIQRIRRRLQQIGQLIRRPVGTVSQAAHVQEIVEQVRAIWSADACVIRLIEGEHLVLLAHSGLPPGTDHPRLTIGWGIGKAVMTGRRPLYIADVDKHPLTAGVKHLLPRSFIFRSYAGTPLWAGDELIGILGLYWTGQGDGLDEFDLDCLHIVGNSVSLAVANNRLYEDLRRSRDHLAGEVVRRRATEKALRLRERFLEAIAQAATRMLMPGAWQTVIGELISRLGQALEVDRAVVYQVESADNGELSAVCRAHWAGAGVTPLSMMQPSYMEWRVRPGVFREWREALEAGRVVAATTAALGEEVRQWVEASGSRAVLLVPVHVSGTFWGLVAVAAGDERRSWTEPEIDAVRASAGVLAAALERERSDQIAWQLRSRLAHADRVSTVSRLAAGLAHEINQPLTAIAAYADACMLAIRNRNPHPEELLADLEGIATHAFRAGRIIRRLRTLMRPRQFQQEQVALEDLVQGAAGLLEHNLSRAGVRLEVRIEPASLVIHTDPVLLHQVLVNLMQNALEAMEQTPPDQRILTVTGSLIDDRTVRIAVRDRGHGFSEEDLARVFEMFYTTKPDGLGIGLCICREIIESMGGRIGVERHPECGSIFWMTLPLQ